MKINWVFLLLPFIAATIGWFTNYIAVKMLFLPKKPIKILFFTLHGIFPKRQNEIAISVGKMVANDLLSSKDLSKKLAAKENVEAIILKIGDSLDEYFELKFPQKFPLLSKIINTKIRNKIKQEMLDEVNTLAPKLIEDQVNNLDQVLNIEKMVTEKVSNLSSEKLEKLMMSIIKKELKFIEIIGAVIGFFIGIVQVILVILL